MIVHNIRRGHVPVKIDLGLGRKVSTAGGLLPMMSFADCGD